jgi:spore coat protein A, manganese oxidase
MDRRRFLTTTAIATVGLGAGSLYRMGRAWAYLPSRPIPKFVTPLRRPGTGPNDVPLAQPDGVGYRGATHYTIDMREFRDQLLPPPNNTTRLWGYTQSAAGGKHLGGVIVARRAAPVQITFRNYLPPRHILPVDTTLPGAEGPRNRTSVHLHGGKVPWVSDGGPHAWWTPDGRRGDSFVDVRKLLDGQASAANASEFYYPNEQSARMLWFHDHALGITRLNAHAGLASAYIITDAYEDQLVAQNGLPGPLDARTHYLIFQDKIFVPPAIDALDPTWNQVVAGSRPGDLWYPHVYEPTRWDLESGEQPPPNPSVVPEMFGDTMLVNGTSYPTLTLEPRIHRLRLLNACNARFLNPRLMHAQAGAPTEADANAPGPGFTQIGTEGGFLPAPVAVNGKGGVPLLLAPAERADLLVDLRRLAPGTTLLLYNDAPAPFPNSDRRYDFYPGNPKTPASAAGFGPDTRTLLQIRIAAPGSTVDPALTLPDRFALTEPFLIEQKAGLPLPVPNGVKVRRLTLSEDFDQYGRLIQFLGTDQPVNLAPETGGQKQAAFGRPYESPPTGIIAAGSTEVWEIANLTADTHPIHFHLVNVQILNRQRFSNVTYGRGKNIPFTGAPIKFLGKPVAPDANEFGWKETVRVNPGEVTRVRMRFDLAVVPFTVPLSNRTGVAGHEFVWHCHILEHEEHDMMRPLIVI